jgi:predicted restriction endonuclease
MPSKPGQRSYRHKSTWMRSQRQAVLKKFGSACALCGYPGDDGKGQGLTQAHNVTPEMGGSNTIDNITLLCRSCHGRIDGSRRYE